MKLNKSNSAADELRIAGNREYKVRRYREALTFYNKSICNAVPGSREFSLAVANRSAVYMEIDEFELCLENIKLAVDCGYPEAKIDTLVERQEKCLDLLEAADPVKHENFFKLKHPLNPKINFVIDAIELCESEKFGRHLITNRALKTGEIVCIEEPFHKFIMNEARFTNCANCLKSEKLNLFPCLKCNNTMFCSKHCMDIGDRFHHFECNVIDFDDEASIFQMAHRIVQEALGMFGKISKLRDFIEFRSKFQTIFDVKAVDEKKLFVAVNSLQRNEIPAGMKPLVDRHVDLIKSITKNQQNQKFLDEFFRKQTQICITNSFGLKGKDGREFGAGIFPLASFFNHSCAPNVTRITLDNKLVFVATRPIERHQQLFICYRSSFFETAKWQRQEELLRCYRFKCACEACCGNYETVTSDESPSPSSIEAAKDEFKRHCEFIDANIKTFPSPDICRWIQRNQSILEFIASHNDV